MKFIINLKFLLPFILILFIGCSEEMEPNMPDPDPDPDPDPIGMVEGTIWTGTPLTFEKDDNTDPTDTANQDRLTDKVILTRGTSGGQIINIASESSANKTNSPVGTEWAIGRTDDDLSKLTFQPFRTAVGNPKDVVGLNLVLHLIEDDIYLNVNFTKWTQGKAGGFAYSRATE